jgi:GxxExxY protein
LKGKRKSYLLDEIHAYKKVDFSRKQSIIELKAINKLEDVHLAKALNYLEAFKLDTGVLINFGSRSLEFKRLGKPRPEE